MTKVLFGSVLSLRGQILEFIQRLSTSCGIPSTGGLITVLINATFLPKLQEFVLEELLKIL